MATDHDSAPTKGAPDLSIEERNQLASADSALACVVEGLEAAEFRHVPGISTAEAAAFTARLLEARAEITARLEGSA